MEKDTRFSLFILRSNLVLGIVASAWLLTAEALFVSVEKDVLFHILTAAVVIACLMLFVTIQGFKKSYTWALKVTTSVFIFNLLLGLYLLIQFFLAEDSSRGIRLIGAVSIIFYFLMAGVMGLYSMRSKEIES